MGSTSDWDTMCHTADVLEKFNVPFEKQIVSAHRTPVWMAEFAESAEARGIEVIVAGAGGAAHLPGMVASHTVLPVLGVPVQSAALQGLDSLLSIVQMPGGVPVGTLAIGKPGAVYQYMGTATAGLSASLAAQDYTDFERWKEVNRRSALTESLQYAVLSQIGVALGKDDLPALYNAADLYVGISRRHDLLVEGFGISLVEASACGLAVVGGRSGGVPDAVHEGETGILVDPDDPAAVAAGVNALLANPERRKELGAAGRKAVETYYNWDRVVQDLRVIDRKYRRG